MRLHKTQTQTQSSQTKTADLSKKTTPNQYLIIDIETLGHGLRAPILAVAAINELGQEFTAKLNIEDQINNGAQPTQATIEWWLSQPAATWIDAYAMGTPEFVLYALNDLYTGGHAWCRGTDFDLPILGNLFHHNIVKYATRDRNWHDWHFAAVRDVRTAEMITGKNPNAQRTHNPLDDCIDAKWIVEKFYTMTKT